MKDYLEASADALYEPEIYPIRFIFLVHKPDYFNNNAKVECLFDLYCDKSKEYKEPLI